VSESVITITKTTRNKVAVDWSTSPTQTKIRCLHNPSKTQTYPTIAPMDFTSRRIFRPNIILFFSWIFLASFSYIHLQTHPPTTPMYFTPFVYMPNMVTKECENWNIAFNYPTIKQT